jgi:hypothetical protein
MQTLNNLSPWRLLCDSFNACIDGQFARRVFSFHFNNLPRPFHSAVIYSLSEQFEPLSLSQFFSAAETTFQMPTQ